MAADIQVICENSNDVCDNNSYSNFLLIFPCFESCFVTTTDSDSSTTNTSENYVDDSDLNYYVPFEIISELETTKIINRYKKTDAWLKKLSESNNRSKVAKGKQYNKRMKFNKKILKKGNFRKK